MKGHIWQPAAHIQRSLEDPEVWVPYIPGGGEEHFRHAGLVRKVKHYVFSQAHVDGIPDRWVNKGDAWEFQVRRPVTEAVEEEPDVNPYQYPDWLTDPELRKRALIVGVGLALIGLVLLRRRRRG